MYYVPDVQRNLYLKEISGLAKVLSGSDALEKFTQTDNLTDLREHLLDWVSQAIGEAVPDAKARMIKLEARQTSLETAARAVVDVPDVAVGRFLPFEAVCYGEHVLVLGTDGGMIDTFEHDDTFKKAIKDQPDFQASGYHIVRLAENAFAHGRTVVKAVAYKAAGDKP
jgi:hypothetical protein